MHVSFFVVNERQPITILKRFNFSLMRIMELAQGCICIERIRSRPGKVFAATIF